MTKPQLFENIILATKVYKSGAVIFGVTLTLCNFINGYRNHPSNGTSGYWKHSETLVQKVNFAVLNSLHAIIKGVICGTLYPYTIYRMTQEHKKYGHSHIYLFPGYQISKNYRESHNYEP